MIFHLGTQWLTFMAILQGSESVKEHVLLQIDTGSELSINGQFGT